MDGLRQGRRFSRLRLLSVLPLFAVCTTRQTNQASVQPSTTQHACCASVLWQRHKGGWYGPPICCSVFVVALDNATMVDDTARQPVRKVTPSTWTGWGRAEASPGWGCWACCYCLRYVPTDKPTKQAFNSQPPSMLAVFRAVTTPQRWMIRPTYAVLFLLLPAFNSQPPSMLAVFRAVTMPQRWMIRPTYAVLFLLLPATMPQWWMIGPANQFYYYYYFTTIIIIISIIVIIISIIITISIFIFTTTTTTTTTTITTTIIITTTTAITIIIIITISMNPNYIFLIPIIICFWSLNNIFFLIPIIFFFWSFTQIVVHHGGSPVTIAFNMFQY